jgi:hypothetical protein
MRRGWRAICSSCKEETDNFTIRTDTGKPRRQCRVCCNERLIRYRKEKPEVYKKSLLNYRINNKEKMLARTREWRKNNLKYDAYRRSLYVLAKNQRLVKWANLNKIKEIYLNCPDGYHVDHIFPLRGKNISGLHVEYNLQYLPAKENMSKGNRVYVE